MKNYTLKVLGRSSHAAALAQRCAIGQIGETLVTQGVSKEAWNSFIFELVKSGIAKKIPEEAILHALNVLDAGNASASRQAIKDLILVTPRLDKAGAPILAEADSADGAVKKGQPLMHEQTVEKYWTSIGGAKAPIDLSKLAW